MLPPHSKVRADTVLMHVLCSAQVAWSSEGLGYSPGVGLGFTPEALTPELLPLLLLLLLLILLLESVTVNNLL